jgi:low temperature requirement protein LtrA
MDGVPHGTLTGSELTQEEVQKEAEKHKSHHMRSVDYSHKMVVMLHRDPVVHEEPHRETFFELFYDLIMVVVFIKLSFLKYSLSAEGLFAVFTLFANFWSCWSLLNTCELSCQ